MLQNLEQIFASVVEQVIPSVVSVSTTKLAKTHLSRVVPVKGQGSGVILSKEGFIVTNAHVVDGAKDVEVALNDGRTYKAVVVGQSKTRDLAILKIDAEEIQPIEMGDSGKLRVGQFAIAIGNPLGLGSTVTFGMVSAVDRTIQGRNTFLEGLIQTSAQINPGNSGGALVDSQGKLIGVPTAMVPWSQGIGFAIAVDTLKGAFEELVETGTIHTPWMGIVGVTMTKGIASHYDLNAERGALLVQVPEGPSRDAGLKAGDVITALDGKEISGMEDLRKRVLRKQSGDKIRVLFSRGKDIFELYVELKQAPE